MRGRGASVSPPLLRLLLDHASVCAGKRGLLLPRQQLLVRRRPLPLLLLVHVALVGASGADKHDPSLLLMSAKYVQCMAGACVSRSIDHVRS